jgi:hypothetical protein
MDWDYWDAQLEGFKNLKLLVKKKGHLDDLFEWYWRSNE